LLPRASACRIRRGGEKKLKVGRGEKGKKGGGGGGIGNLDHDLVL